RRGTDDPRRRGVGCVASRCRSPVARSRRRACQRPRRRRRRLPRPEPAGGVNVDELIALSAAQAADRVASGDLDAAELFEAYRARSAADDLNAYTWVAD